MKKFEIFMDKNFNVKEIWFGDYKITGIENIKIYIDPIRTHVMFEILPLNVELKLWEDEYGE